MIEDCYSVVTELFVGSHFCSLCCLKGTLSQAAEIQLAFQSVPSGLLQEYDVFWHWEIAP